MSYNPTYWGVGDKITAKKLNNIENGILDIEEEILNTSGQLNRAVDAKLNRNQGIENVGKNLVVNGAGEIAPGSLPITLDTTLKTTAKAADAGAVGDEIVRIDNALAALGNGTPIPVNNSSGMVDTTKTYLYTGTQSAYTKGDWYYYSGSAWVSGGHYGDLATDMTLSQEGYAADAKMTGEALKQLSIEKNPGWYSAFEYPHYIEESGKWGGSSSTHYCFPTEGISEIYMYGATIPYVYCFLRTHDDTGMNVNADFATGSVRTVIVAGRDVTVKVPEDANYFYLQGSTGGINYFPSELSFDGLDYTSTMHSMMSSNQRKILMTEALFNGIDFSYKAIEKRGLLSWDGTYNEMGQTHICIPKNNHKTVTITGGDTTTAMAFLIEDISGFQLSPIFTYQRETIEYEDGSIVDEIVYDDETHEPVQNVVRYLISPDRTYSFNIPEECNYIYLHCRSKTQATNYLPRFLKFDNTVLIEQPSKKGSPEVVFFDDFDGDELSNKWKKLNASVNSLRSYYSRFYTDDEDCYVSDGCLVLKCMVDNTGVDLGTAAVLDDEGNDDHYVPRVYKAAYVSTEDTFAMRQGAISARIRMSDELTEGFPFTFFTFAQNKVWPEAPEFDIFEGTSQKITSPVTTGNGNTYEIGTPRFSVGNHTHYINEEGENAEISYYFDIHYDRTEEYNYSPGYKVTDWHIYKVEWDDETVSYYVDDSMIKRIDLTSMNHNSDFLSPADIRFNMKAKLWATKPESSMYVDWVKAENYTGKQPLESIEHDDLTISVGQTVYLTPEFSPANNVNCAFTVTVDNPNVVLLENYQPEYTFVWHRIVGLAEGTAHVTLTSANGKVTKTFTVVVTPQQQ